MAGKRKFQTFNNTFQLDPIQARKLVATLTKREKQTAERMSLGMTSDEIADDLEISPETLNTYRASVKKKLKTTGMGIARVWFCAQM